MGKILIHNLHGALHEEMEIYAIGDPNEKSKAYNHYGIESRKFPGQEIKFQSGAINENGINGISNEALLLIILDRLNCWQTSEFKNRENAICITKLEEALMWMQKRTIERVQRGVEGTHEK